MSVQIKIDEKTISVPEGFSVREAALKNGIYIPGLCGHPDLPLAREVRWAQTVYRGNDVIVGDVPEGPAEVAGCNLCLVKVNGESQLVRACETSVAPGMVVQTKGEDIQRARQQELAKILAHHPHACLTCAQRQGCSLTSCSSNVPVDERCCILLNRCEIGKVADFIGIPEYTPKYVFEAFPRAFDDPFFERDYNLCIGCTRCVRICSDVRGIQALAATRKDDRIWIGTSQAGALAESYCRFCGACVEVCPTGALRDRPDSKPVKHGEFAPCIAACPAGIDIPAYLRHIALGDYAGALRVIYDRVPFPGILGYVCFHPCEEVCKRDVLDDSLAICALKRFAYEAAKDQKLTSLEKAPPTGKRIAVIGSGPAGLTAAFYLARAGHEVEVFEAGDKPGGMLRQAIPEYRLPETVLDEELQALQTLGVRFRSQQKLGQHFQLKGLLANGYSAVLLTVGMSGSRQLGVPGEDFSGVVEALTFLRSIRRGEAEKLDGRVVVIGGGNVAVDAAMSARRLGSRDVTMVCLEQPEEMPAHAWEIEQATAEGVAIKNGWGPVEFVGSDGKLQKVRFKHCTRVFDSQGAFNPQYDENEKMEIEADYAIVAIGQKLEREDLVGLENLNITPSGLIRVNPETGLTDLPFLFAAGEASDGPGSVIEAIASGRRAADGIDRALGGSGIARPPVSDAEADNPVLGRDEEFHRRLALRPEQRAAGQRVLDFLVIEQTFPAACAQQEASRCLRCNLRALITPVVLPPDKWQPLTRAALADIPNREGVYLIAGSDRKTIIIAGVPDLHAALEGECDGQKDGALFCWEEDRMYSKRESELIQQHLQQYGEMPGGGAGELDDLF